jgi:hypothetical protein
MRSLIALIAIAALGLGVWYFQLGDGASGEAWSVARIAEDPVGYLEASTASLRRSRDELEARRRDLRRAIAEAETEARSEAIAASQARAKLELARQAYLKARQADSWPIRVDGLEYDRLRLENRLRQLDTEAQGRAARADAAARFDTDGRAELSRIETALAENRRLDADVAARLRKARLDASRAELEALSGELANLDAMSRALTEEKAVLSLDDLLSSPAAGGRDIDTILSEENR